MKRSPLRRKHPMIRKAKRARPKRSAYARRPRDRAFLDYVHTLPCAVPRFPISWKYELTPCSGPIEADHMGERGQGRTAADDTCVPMCHLHHVERTIHRGVFWHATKAELREWRAVVIAATQESFRDYGCHG